MKRLPGVTTNFTAHPTPAALQDGDDILPALPIWAVALGVFSLLTLGLTSIPAVVCGHRALAGARKRQAGLLERRAAVAGLFVGYLGVLLMASVVAGAVRLQL